MRHLSISRRVALAAVVALLAAACGDDGGSAQPPDTAPDFPAPTTTASTTTVPSPSLPDVEVTLTPVATAAQPVALAHRPGDPDDVLWVAEKTGTVQRLTLADGTTVAADDAQVDLTGEVSQGNEQGLLGLAFAPDGSHLYVNYTDTSGTTQVVEYAMAGDDVDAGSARTVLWVGQPFSNHNGGNLAFGPDGMLYIGLGDGGSGGDPEGNGQDPSTLLGSMLRIDPRGQGDGAYSVPRDNPFLDRAGRRDVWAYGLRNPWRYSFDSGTGDLWIGDVGQNRIEEVDRLPADAEPGANLGWNELEGREPYEGGTPPADAVPPVFQYGRDGGACSVTGGYVYRGSAVPDLVGAYVYGDYCVSEVRALVLDGDDVEERSLDVGTDPNTLVSFGEGADGELYVLSIAGQISRIDPA